MVKEINFRLKDNILFPATGQATMVVNSEIPDSWIDAPAALHVLWQSSKDHGNIKWRVSAGFYMDGEIVYNPPRDIIIPAKAPNADLELVVKNLDMSGAVPGAVIYLSIDRLGQDPMDTCVGTVKLVSVSIKLR